MVIKKPGPCAICSKKAVSRMVRFNRIINEQNAKQIFVSRR